MKFINNIPQFDETNDKSAAGYFNEKLREAFAERVCVKCEFFLDQPFNDSMCLILNRVKFNDINEDPKKFSCAAWVKKEG